MTQNARILAHFQSGRSLTGLEALNLFGCSRLAARVGDLIADGHPVDGEMVTVASGKRVKRYWLRRGQGRLFGGGECPE